MICPIILHGNLVTGRHLDRDADCPQDECAWWDSTQACCAIKANARYLVDILTALNLVQHLTRDRDGD